MRNYLMVGAGGTGSHLLAPLVTYLRAFHTDGEWNLHVVDGDSVEAKNLERQQFLPGQVTMNKAEAAVQQIADPNLKAYAEYLSDQNIERFLQDGDVVFICADNFTVRKRIEDKALALPNVTVINGGNEATDGSVQLWVRENGANITPRIGYLHPEIAIALGADRAALSCQQIAALPGGQQTLIANLQSATWMLTALWRFHQGHHKPAGDPNPKTWTELQFDALAGKVEHIDQRLSSHWSTA